MGLSLVDRVVLGELTEVYPADLVDAVVAKAGVRETRVRLLPARLMVYFVLGRALFSPDPYREVLRELAEAARGADGWDGWRVPDKAAIVRARRRLGAEPLRELLAQVGPVATEATAGAFWRGWRLMVVDGTTVETADTPANDAEFGRPRNQRGRPAGYPVARVAVLAESGTHVVVDAAVGPYARGEITLAEVLLGSLQPGMLLLADRGFPGVMLWKKAAATGADLLWRVQSKWTLAPEEVLADGSWISTVRIKRAKGRPDTGRESIRVRVIEYRLRDPGRDADRHYRLVTTVLDPLRAPARELAALYAERWEAETTLAEWKTAQIGSGHVLASKVPELVYQEIYAHLAVHAAIRAQMHRVATTLPDPLDPDRLSFTAALRAARRSVTRPTRSFSP